MPDIKQEYNPCPCFDMLAWNDGIENTKIPRLFARAFTHPPRCNNRANSQIIARFLAICSAMLIAIISEILMSTLVKISRFRSRCKNRDLYPAINSCKCECPYYYPSGIIAQITQNKMTIEVTNGLTIESLMTRLHSPSA